MHSFTRLCPALCMRVRPWGLLVGATTALAASACRWAPCVDIYALGNRSSPEFDRVLALVGQSEFPFVADAGVVAPYQLTRDGWELDTVSGTLGSPHMFSAASKEGFHLAVLALCVSDTDSSPLLSALCGDADWVARQLGAKLDGYASFDAQFPGFGGFLPWFAISNTTGAPGLLSGWTDQVPALDNGEFFWGLVACLRAVEVASGPSSALSMRLRGKVNQLTSNFRTIFYDPVGGPFVASISKIQNVSLPVSANVYSVSPGSVLNDPFEGELATWILDLFGGLSLAEREALWVAKRPQLRAVTTSAGLSIQEGFWFSAHEQMKLLFMPYTSSPRAHQVFRACEVARANHSAALGIPGLFASVNDVAANTTRLPPIPDYVSAAGIQQFASQPVLRTDVITPYGSMALALLEPRSALAWYVTMLRGVAMQNAFGSTESANVNGTEISPLITWDSKITTLLGLAGGVGPLVSSWLESLPGGDALLQRFIQVVEREYSLVFPDQPHVLDLPIALPTAAIPHTPSLAPFPNCQ
jgi:hypothetical protein